MTTSNENAIRAYQTMHLFGSGYKASKLPLDGAFWSIRFDDNTRLVLVVRRTIRFSCCNSG